LYRNYCTVDFIVASWIPEHTDIFSYHIYASELLEFALLCVCVCRTILH